MTTMMSPNVGDDTITENLVLVCVQSSKQGSEKHRAAHQEGINSAIGVL